MSWAWIVRPEDDRKKIYGAVDEYSLMANVEHTDGHDFFIEAAVPAGGGPPPRIKTREEEGFYVTECELFFEPAEKVKKFVAIAKEYEVEFMDEA